MIRNMEHFSLCIFAFVILFNSSQSQYTSEYTPQEGNVKEPPKGPPQPYPYALSSTYLTYLARTEVEIYKEMVKYAQALHERLGMIHA